MNKGLFGEGFPYTNFHDLNLDWIIKTLISFDAKLDSAIAAKIKVANPIQWDITSQYEQYTIVMDGGNAYLSLEPVPYGIAISNEEYWQKIFDLSLIFESLKNAISFNDDEDSSTTSENRAINDLVWRNNILYRIKQAMTLGDEYTSSNSEQTSTEIWVKLLLSALKDYIDDEIEDVNESIDAVDDKLDTDGKDIFIVSAVLRNLGTGWEMLTTGQHTPVNIDSVSVNANGDIEVNFSKNGHNVISFIAVPDETFAEFMTMGSSVDTNKARIRLFSLPEVYGGYVAYNGSSWDISGSNFSSASWHNGSGHLVLSVPNHGFVTRTDKDAMLISCNGRGCDARLDGGHGIYDEHIAFYDTSGQQIFTPNTSMKVFATKQFPAKQINANNVVSQYGNIWIYGIIEK